jgi:hypothetical protein
MSRFYLILTLIPTIVFTVVLLVIHAQPYDDHQLRALLLPDSCAAPCFMGIRPGITTVEQALALLRQNDGVQIIKVDPTEVNGSASQITRISWSWNTTSPQRSPFIDTRKSGVINVSDGKVYGIDIETSVQLGDYWLVENAPKAYNLRTIATSDAGNLLMVLLIDGQSGTILKGTKRCPYLSSRLWQTKMTISFRSVQDTRSLGDQFADPFLLQHIRDLKQKCL